MAFRSRRSTPRTKDDPYPLRMFAEDSCEFALWGPLHEPPPGVSEDTSYRHLEDMLPIPADLRARLFEWARQNTLIRSDHGPAELDWMGFDLSRELATALGELYRSSTRRPVQATTALSCVAWPPRSRCLAGV